MREKGERRRGENGGIGGDEKKDINVYTQDNHAHV